MQRLGPLACGVVVSSHNAARLLGRQRAGIRVTADGVNDSLSSAASRPDSSKPLKLSVPRHSLSGVSTTPTRIHATRRGLPRRAGVRNANT
jgi:hypothetical protein